MKLLALSLITLSLLAAGCGSTNMSCSGLNCEVKSENKTTDLSYQYNENGCDTGVVRASSNAELCAKLRDDSANRYCARETRKESFRNECPGQAWE